MGPLGAASCAEPSAYADPAAAAGPAAVRVASDPSTSAPTPYKLNEASLCRMHFLLIVVDIPIIDTFFLTLYANGLCLEF